jgi:hypothetical protein
MGIPQEGRLRRQRRHHLLLLLPRRLRAVSHAPPLPLRHQLVAAAGVLRCAAVLEALVQGPAVIDTRVLHAPGPRRRAALAAPHALRLSRLLGIRHAPRALVAGEKLLQGVRGRQLAGVALAARRGGAARDLLALQARAYDGGRLISLGGCAGAMY